MESKSYSKNQKIAIEHGTGPLMVLAGPGSGKTFVITHRVKYLIDMLHIPPSQILVVTFSRAAAQEMKERFDKLYEENKPRRGVTWGTFHSVYFGILKIAYGYHSSQVATDEDRYKVLREQVLKYNILTEDISDFCTTLLGEISILKQDQIAIEHYYSSSCSAEIFREIFVAYEAYLASINKIDFEDMLLLTYELISQREDIRKALMRRYRYILIDEFQDINRLQYMIIKLIVGNEENLTVVGDDDQSIYRFRGARPEIMLGFEKDFPKTVRVLLDKNFRSSTQIVTTAMQLIKHNTERFDKCFQAVRGDKVPVSMLSFPTHMAEIKTIIADVKSYIQAGVDMNQLAVLYRTNLVPRLLCECLMRQNIPFVMRDNIPNIYDHWIARDIKAYCRLAMGMESRGDLTRIANKPLRYISREALLASGGQIEGLLDFYEDKTFMLKKVLELRSQIRTIRSIKPATAFRFIRKTCGYDDYIETYCDERGIDSEDFFDILEELESSASCHLTFQNWFNHMEEMKANLLENAKRAHEVRSGLQLMTFHGSKGLEFEIVYILDVHGGVVPYKKAKSNEEIEEERRMLYVAMTRAKDKLYICHCKANVHKEIEESIFLKELLG